MKKALQSRLPYVDRRMRMRTVVRFVPERLGNTAQLGLFAALTVFMYSDLSQLKIDELFYGHRRSSQRFSLGIGWHSDFAAGCICGFHRPP